MEKKDLKKTLERMFPEARIAKGDGYWSVVTDDGFEETSESYTVDDHGRLVNFAVSIVEI